MVGELFPNIEVLHLFNIRLSIPLIFFLSFFISIFCMFLLQNKASLNAYIKFPDGFICVWAMIYVIACEPEISLLSHFLLSI